jgi:hypothetical protein
MRGPGLALGGLFVRMRVASLDATRGAHDEGGDGTRDEAEYTPRNGRRNAELQDGEPCSRRIGVEAHDKPGDRPDCAGRARSDAGKAGGRGQVTKRTQGRASQRHALIVARQAGGSTPSRLRIHHRGVESPGAARYADQPLLSPRGS